MKTINKQIALSLKNPIIQNHVVYGQEVLPGLAFIDMLYQIFREHGYDYSRLQLRNLSIYRPLAVGNNAVVVLRIQCKEVSNGHWLIAVEGQEKQNGHSLADSKQYVKAEMLECPQTNFEESLAFDEMLGHEGRSIMLEELYQQCRNQELVHTGFMKAEGQIHECDANVLMDITVGSEYQSQTGHFMFHPALIDGSGVGSNHLLAALLEGEQRLYLPLFYESFKASELLQEGCFTRIQRSSFRRDKELVYLTLEFFNRAGKKVAELRNFTSKLVRGAELINPERKESAQSEQEQNTGKVRSIVQTPVVRPSQEGTAEYEEIELFLRQLFAQRLGKAEEEIETDIGYYQMGLDSPGLLQVVETIGDQIGAALSPTLLFEYTTVSELSTYLAKHYAGAFPASLPEGEEAPAPYNVEPFTHAAAEEIATHGVPETEGSSSRTTASVVDTDIAIIGMAGRYPQANNIHEYWNNLKAGKDCITEIPKSRWDWRRFEDMTSPSGKKLTKWGGFIDQADCFDPHFFRITPREAETMDPQERLFLETCWETIEDAGYTPKTLVRPSGRYNRQHVGVFVGVMHKDYTLVGAEGMTEENRYPLSLNYAQIANRVSYFCNFHGPSMAVDTVCSSSLTAVHLALESIRHGECEVALAGGVNLSLHPGKYMTYGIWDMFSSDGYCHTFGKGGDGYVPGEGIGAVLLKPLSKAVQDGDRIYAVIKGSAINHVGTVSGISVPSPVAQADAIESCLTKTGIDPRTISYVEAHGTGTSLGDPIEIQGLAKAFEAYTQDKQFCSIGSVKSNIGHAESAAGISGLCKVALQLHNRTLVPSLHSEELNPYLQLDQTPFYVQQSLETWKQQLVKVNGIETRYPRRAGLSSFGATGSNAHLILEEYASGVEQNRAAEPHAPQQTPVIVPLSAKTQERLQAYARNLSRYLHEGIQLRDLAYTLQVGREAMEARVAFVVEDLADLTAKLEAFGAGRETIQDCWSGHIRKGKAKTPKDASIMFSQPVAEANLSEIAESWVKGTEPDWQALYEAARPNRISLPTYPFEKVRYWLPEPIVTEPRTAQQLTHPVADNKLHPLLHQNVSDISGVRFRSVFTGNEFFLADHIVKGKRLLSGAAYLEIARAAVEQAIPDHEQARIQLRSVVWLRPFAAGERETELQVRLYPGENEELIYEVYGPSEDSDSTPAVYSQGRAVYSLSSDSKTPVWNLQELLTCCSTTTIAADSCYDAYCSMGIVHGAGHRGVVELHIGENQVLAKLSLPAAAADDINPYVLHPGLVDSALQATIGLKWNGKAIEFDVNRPMLPFALEEADIFGPCPASLWAYIRYSEGSGAGDNVLKLDIDLIDDAGRSVAALRGYSARVMGDRAGAGKSSNELLYLEQVWEENAGEAASGDSEFGIRRVILCDWDPAVGRGVQAFTNSVLLQERDTEIHQRFEYYALQAFEDIQTLLKSRPKEKILVQLVVPEQGGTQLLGGLSGLLKTAQLENPALTGQLIELQPESSAEDILQRLKENEKFPHDKHIRYVNNQRWAAEWKEWAAAEGEELIPWKDHGVYLITGGAGGLGLIFAAEIAGKVKEPVLILTGRSPLSSEKQSQLKKLERLGAKVVYQQMDLTQETDTHGLIEFILAEHGRLSGIVHSAGIIQDNFIIKKSKEEVQAVLAPKVKGLVHLDEASKELPLDFFILFSSGAGAVGSSGQADYSMANAFMNSYAEYRTELVTVKERQGRTLSVSWPLWKDGGMGVDDETAKALTRDTGMAAMETTSGIRALYQAWASGKSQVMVVEGVVARMRSFMKQANLTTGAAVRENRVEPLMAEGRFREKAENYFKNVLASVTKLPVNRIEVDAPMEDYGIDSILIMHLNGVLETTFGSLPKTLFFEYTDIRSLTEYFMETQHTKLSELLGIFEEAKSEANSGTDRSEEPEATSIISGHRTPFLQLQRPVEAPGEINEPVQKDLGIAVIGLAGRYPQADNVQELWSNLTNGKDCIVEIPDERWDHSLYYDAEKGKPGKTYSKWGGFINDVDKFDPQFFHISPREAELMDPQERLFLQCVYETIEDAGYTRDNLTGHKGADLGSRVGVYVGVMYEEYQLYGAQEQVLGTPKALSGNPSSIANRVSYFFNFLGPSIALDTMCSSSLTAIHLACQSLRQGECEVAIAGGVNVSIHPNKYLLLGQGNFVSSKGRCESFGQGGDGYVPGEGVGAVLLKPLAKAIADGDHIYGIIKGTAVNHGGKTNGYSVPNPAAQADVIRRSWQAAKVDPRTVSYIEAHGTGTTLGDPIEIAGLARVFEEHTQEKQFCAIGSAKSNIGHCESAAGIAGLTKILLQLAYGQLVPSLHSGKLNENIDFANSPFKVQQELAEWKRPTVEVNGQQQEFPRIAGVSSFGAGGVNAHIVVEEYRLDSRANAEQRMVSPSWDGPVVIVLSAWNGERLTKQAERLLAALQTGKYSDADLVRIAYTLQVGREAMNERLALLAGSIEELEAKLQLFVDGYEGIAELRRGQVKANKDALAAIMSDEDMSVTIEAWIGKRKYGKLMDLWTKGLKVDWSSFYGDIRPIRISLPTYPFAKERFWIGEHGRKTGRTGYETRPDEPRTARQSLAADPSQVKPLLSEMPAAAAVTANPVHVALRPLNEDTLHFVQRTDEITGSTSPASAPKRDAIVFPAVPLEALHAEMRASLAEVLYMQVDEIYTDETFVDLGMDSITGLEWIKAINKRYGTSIAVTKVYDYPTIQDFAGYLKTMMAKQHDDNEAGKSSGSDVPVSAPVNPAPVVLRPLLGEPGITSSDELVTISSTEASEEVLISDAGTTAAVTPGARSTIVTSAEILQTELIASLAEVLYMSENEVDADEKFIDLGMDSITGVEWIKALNKRYGATIPVTKIYDYPTIRDFVGYLRKELSISGDAGRSVVRDLQPEGMKLTKPEEAEILTEIAAPPSASAPQLASVPAPGATKSPKKTVESESAAVREPIAIVGMSGRYPGASNLRQYWENLVQGTNSVREIPASRWNVNQYYDPTPSKKGKIYCKSLGMLDDVECFDPLFFHISPSEAELMDPQQRIFLEEGFKAFEDAGYSVSSLSNTKCGVYLGIMSNEYGSMMSDIQSSASATGSSFAIAAARISYYLNLKGPAIPIDTACSSSLVGTHLACQALASREIDMALVGGVTLYLTPGSYMSMCSAGMLSPDGQCMTFDNRANGFVPGEGAGALVLKRLSDAEAAGDQIYGVIVGSGINQDGRTNGITAPSASSQMELEREIYEKYNINPESISYAEMHGTGTKQGDPIELEALSTVFKEKTAKKNFCAIGSVKSNIGHTSAASGIASVQKVLLCMQKETLVPTLNFHQPNEHFDFANSPFYVNTQVKPWTSTGSLPLRACVSSFGFSGTNAHVVVEAYVPGTARPSASPSTRETGKSLLMVLSAKKKEQLNTQVREIKNFLLAEPDLELADAAYTLQIGREPMDYRVAVVADSREKLLDLLDAYQSGHPAEGVFTAYVKESRQEIRMFETDEDAKALSEAWIDKKKLHKIAELWVKGWNLDWNRLYGEIKPHRISLPAYSFAKERYWLSKLTLQSDHVSPLATSSIEADLPGTAATKRVPRLLRKHWRPSSSTQARKNVQSVLILANSETANLADKLSRYFPRHEVVDVDRTDFVTSEYEWHIYDGLVDLIGCGTEADESLGWIDWLQKLVEHGNKEGLTLLGVTKGLESLQNGHVNLAGASHSGLYRMIQSEYSYLHSRHMDADAYAQDDELAGLIAEELILDSEEPEVCYRKGQRYTSLLEEESLSVVNGESALEVEAFPEDRVLLITGGTRGLGLLCAQHFVRKYNVKKLVLTGREPLPPRDEWDRLNQMNDPTRRKIRAIQELEDLGIQVHVLSLRLSDEAAVLQSLQDIERNLGPIGGVIHCAGIAEWRNPAFIRKHAEDIKRVLEPKVEGLQILYRLLPKEPLQFFVLFSSVSSIVPSLASGQSDYAMSNAYMDYFAEAYQEEVPIVSIQWPNWKESGMGEAKSKSYGETGLLGMTDVEGLQWLDLILAWKLRSVVLPAVVDTEHWKPDMLMRRDIRKMAPSTAGNVRAKSPEAVSTRATGDIYEKTQAWLIELFAKELKILPDDLAADEPFQEYGVDSIILTQLLQQINGEIEANLDPSIIYEYPTIQSFATWLAKDFESALTKVLGNLPPSPVYNGTSEQLTAGPLVDRDQSELSDELKNRSSVRGTQANDIAVVGLSCRFPGAENLNAFWELLSAGRSAIRQVPEERWHHEGVCYAGLLNDIHHFDPSFFQLSEENAKAMDPQSLVVLEQCLNLWYHAGYAHEEVKGKAIGVYLGGRSQHRPTEESLQHVRNPIAAMGQNYMAANVSQFFDLRGPSVVLDTACSSALVGMNMAIQALHSGEIESAVVGGVSLLDTEAAYRMFKQRGILSEGSSFHIFDERGSGIVLGEGVGMVLLKTLDQALRDGDSIYAVVKAAAVNNDGRTVGPAAPNPQAQKDVMRAALDRSGKRPEEISYIEANGSGSAVTDLLELKAIRSVYRAEGPAPIGVGSVKPNIGHPLCAEGIASFIKVVLMLQHRRQVPFLSGEQAMPHFDPESTGIHFNRGTTEWDESQPVAAINCFADGGTNAHVILESWAEPAGYLTRRRPLPAPELKKRILTAPEAAVTAATKIAEEPQVAQGTKGIFWKTFA